eukprot:7866602-Alexandrium_andersonii.AAC.1
MQRHEGLIPPQGRPSMATTAQAREFHGHRPRDAETKARVNQGAGTNQLFETPPDAPGCPMWPPEPSS